MVKIILASDHAGFGLKEALKPLLRELKMPYEDIGPKQLDKADDYPDFIIPAAQKVASVPEGTFGIIAGWSGQGEAMAANKVKGIRAAVYYGGQPKIIRLSREHNDANVLSLGAGFLKTEEALDAVREWLATKFTKEERHVRRIAKVATYERSHR